MSNTDLIDVVVSTITREAAGIATFELRRRDGVELPAFSAGAHIDVHLPNGAVRAYSICNPQQQRDRYVVAVADSANSRGGSSFMHSNIAVGDALMVGAPRNNFPLVEDASHSVFIAGGIGITPIFCMVQRLEQLGRSWELIYCSRTPPQTAFLEQLSGQPYEGKVRFNFDGEPGGTMLDIAGLVADVPASAHIYCCGPQPMLDAFEQATAARSPETAHLERFSAKDAPATSGGFAVKLARSGKEVRVPEGKTILDALLEINVLTPYSCLEGTCGECLTRVLSGIPDHRDVFLSKEEQEANDQMTICCSGSKSACLVLDL